MADSDWIDDPSPQDTDWVDDPEVGMLESGIRGLAQGGSLGFADEITGGLESLFTDKSYQQARDESRKNYEAAQKANPVTYGAGEVGGAVGTAFIPGLNAASGAKLAAIAGKGALAGSIAGLGTSEADLTEGDYMGALADTGKGAALGGGLGVGAGLAGKGLQKLSNSNLVQKLSSKLGNKLEDAGGNLIENATGATAVQASKFQPGAGKELYKRGLVKFGDNATNIADRTERAMSAAGSDIDDALKALDAKGVTASADNVVQALQQKISQLRQDPSQAGVVRKLEGIVDDIITTGNSNIPISQAEATKRGFNKAAGNWMDPEAGQAGKQAYLGYMDEVERAANAADPALAKKFEAGKETFGLLAPIQEAAERRSTQLNQSPLGGLGDWAAGGAGGAAGGPIGAAASVFGKKVVAPRLTSSGGVSLMRISELVKAAPQKFGQFANVLQRAQQRGPQGVASTHFLLQQTNPEYRNILTRVAEDPEEQQ